MWKTAECLCLSCEMAWEWHGSQSNSVSAQYFWGKWDMLIDTMNTTAHNVTLVSLSLSWTKWNALNSMNFQSNSHRDTQHIIINETAHAHNTLDDRELMETETFFYCYSFHVQEVHFVHDSRGKKIDFFAIVRSVVRYWKVNTSTLYCNNRPTFTASNRSITLVARFNFSLNFTSRTEAPSPLPYFVCVTWRWSGHLRQSNGKWKWQSNWQYFNVKWFMRELYSTHVCLVGP